MPSDAAYQAFLGVTLPQLCVPFVHYNVLSIVPTNLLVAWCVCGCHEKA